MNNLILVRHGQSQWNKERRFTGWADIDLTNQGKSQAKYAGELIKKLNIDFHTCFTSNLKRAINSLDIILESLNNKKVEIIRTELLNERHYGGLTGLNKDETIKKYGEKQVKIWRRSFDIPPPKMESIHPYKNKIKSDILSESLKDTFERVIPFFKEKIEKKLSENVIISAHGNSIRSLCKYLFDISNEEISKLEIPTGNPLILKFDGNDKLLNAKYLDKERAKDLIKFG